MKQVYLKGVYHALLPDDRWVRDTLMLKVIEMKYKDSFIVSFWAWVFNALAKISLLYWIRRFTKSSSYFFVEIWVLANTILAISASIFAIQLNGNYFLWILSIYGLFRIIEVVVYQINVLLFDPFRVGKDYKIKSATRLVILLLHNYLEIIGWFTMFQIFIIKLNFLQVKNWFSHIKMNISCMTTYQSNDLLNSIKTVPYASDFVFIETNVGFLLTLIVLARFLGMLPTVNQIEEF